MKKKDEICILTIDDEDIVRQGIADYLEDCGYKVLQAENGEAGIKIFKQFQPDLILTDLKMPGISGMEVLKSIVEISPETPVIIVSGTGDIHDAIESTHVGAWDYVLKPIIDNATLEHSIQRALERADLIKLNRIYRENLENALQIAERDIKMAKNVQTKFYPKDTPASDEWDIAYYFKPMAGVSGDLYDFYTTDGIVEGVALFDVSGHGIASALITMLAKSTIFRCFSRMKDVALNTVMNTINDNLITDIDNVDNYLTGILLRFNNNTIEYVNAAHPDLLIKHNNTGKITDVGGSYDYENGTFLGVSCLAQDYRLLNINIEKGDRFLLFTDGIIEAANIDDVNYGIKRLMKTFEESPAQGTSKEILNYIIDDLEQYRKNARLQDDITIILLTKL